MQSSTIKISNSQSQTKKLGKQLATKLKGGEIIGLSGNLGGGKTVFTKGIAKGLGIKQNITSPTFVFWRIYQVPNKKKIKYFCHIDLYRLQKQSDFIALGIFEYWQRDDTVCVIEWAEKIKRYLQIKKSFFIKFEVVNENMRRLIIK